MLLPIENKYKKLSILGRRWNTFFCPFCPIKISRQKGSITKATLRQSLHHNVCVTNIPMHKATLMQLPRTLPDILQKRVSYEHPNTSPITNPGCPKAKSTSDIVLTNTSHHNHVQSSRKAFNSMYLGAKPFAARNSCASLK